MSSKENKQRFIKIISVLQVEEKAYVVDALKDKEVGKQHKLWNCNKYKENIPPDDMTFTPSMGTKILSI